MSKKEIALLAKHVSDLLLRVNNLDEQIQHVNERVDMVLEAVRK